MLITSHHARVFDGITQARMRALAGDQSPDTMQETCRYAQERPDDTHCDKRAAFLWVQPPSGNVIPLCRRHADSWVQDMGTAEDWQPPVLIPLRGRKP